MSMTSESPSMAHRGPASRTAVVHCDTAAMGRPSEDTLVAVEAHLRLEVERGGYVAEAQAQESISLLRAQLGELFGGTPDGVAFVESGNAALQRLLTVWPLPEDAVVGVAVTGWGPNMEALDRNGLAATPLAVDDLGRIDIDALDVRLVRDRLDLIIVDHVASHRGLIQPVADVLRVAHGHDVPVWVDSAQAVGHVDCRTDADAVFATSRKWLRGPRGVGMLHVAARHHDTLRLPRLGRDSHRPPVQTLDSSEANIAGRVGLSTAVAAAIASSLDTTFLELAAVGEQIRQLVQDVPGWQVYGPGSPAGAITTIEPTDDRDVQAAHRSLLEDHRVLTTLVMPWRAPWELDNGAEPHAPMIRLSPHTDFTAQDAQRLEEALASL